MNQEEKICKPYLKKVRCFQTEIPLRFEIAGNDLKSCSFIFPPGYSIYVEQFIMHNPGPDNFVLLDGKPLEYSSELKWSNRRQSYWEILDKDNPLKGKSIQRSNYPCVKTIKVCLSRILVFSFITQFH